MPSNYLILCHPLLHLLSILISIRVFSNESALNIMWPKYCSFNFSISPSNEHSGLISFRIDWFDLLAVQGILKSLLQYHSSKAGLLPESNTHGRKEPRGTGLWHRWFVFNKANLLTFILYLLKDSLVTKASPKLRSCHSSQSQILSLQSSGQGYLIFALVSKDIICRNLVKDFGAEWRGGLWSVILEFLIN